MHIPLHLFHLYKYTYTYESMRRCIYASYCSTDTSCHGKSAIRRFPKVLVSFTKEPYKYSAIYVR